MADLDAELLALAGGDSSDEEDTKQTTTAAKLESPSSSAVSSDRGVNRSSANRSNAAQKKISKSRAGQGKSVKKSRKDDSEEEGEASSTLGTPNSLDSAPMSESEAEDSPTGEADNDGPIYPIENKFYSEKDKAEIMALSEVQRESILAERAQEVERKQQDQILRRLYQGYQAKDGEKAKAAQKKRKAGAADLEDVHRKSSRQKTTLGGRKVGETSDAMEAYKRQREQKGLLNEQRKREGEERKDRKSRGSMEDLDADAEGESEVEWDDGKPRAGRRSESRTRDEQPADLNDYNHVRVGRDNFAKVCFYPGFEDAIKNCFARISIGPDKASGENIYRVAQVKGFTEGKPYAMEGANGKPFSTNQYALVTVGKSEKEWPFIACSNSKFTETELERYKKTLATETLPLPTKPFLISKVNDINNLINHRFTDQEIQEKLKRAGVLTTKFASLERSVLLTRRKEAEARNDEAAIAKIDAELDALKPPKLAFNTSLNRGPAKNSAAATGQPTQQERLAELNRRNRKANVEEVRKAQQAERKAEALARKAIERGEAVANPFARVKTRAKTHHDTKDLLAPPKRSKNDDLFEGSSRDVSRAGTPSSVARTGTPGKMSGVGTPQRSGTPAAGGKGGEKKGGLFVIRNRNMDDDLMAAIDMGIDIEI